MIRPVRRGLLVIGSAVATHEWARAFALEVPQDCLFVSPTDPDAVHPRRLHQHLGRSLALVVLDAHEGLDPDTLAACHGFVRAGGALLLRLFPEVHVSGHALAAWPHTPDEVGRRFERRARTLLMRRFEVIEADRFPVVPLPPPPPIAAGTDEQRALLAMLNPAAGAATVLTADRGRGKSAAMGLWLASLPPHTRVAVTATSPEAAAEVFRFAPRASFVPLGELPDPRLEVLVVDEAATLPVPLLRRLTVGHPHTHLAFATTVHGYEGTGRGFALRFVPWLTNTRQTSRHTLREPIRWAADCPLERAIFEALVLDAELPTVGSVGDRAKISKIEILDRQDFSAATPEAERDLNDLFGLLIHAHYRTAPSDLLRLMDAPNLAVHVVRAGQEDRIVAACLIAREGGLTPELARAVHSGATRLVAHALADALVAHLGEVSAGPMTMVRSVRIATHPELRRLGLARALVDHVHQSYEVDLFGTLFGASPDLLAFRHSLGYRLLRVSASRNLNTGEPSVLMVRPVSERAQSLVARLGEALVRELPTQLELLKKEGLGLDIELEDALRTYALGGGSAALVDKVPADRAYTDEEVLRLVHEYTSGPRTFESLATAIHQFVIRRDLSSLSPSERAVVEARAIAYESWHKAADVAGLAHPGLAMKTMRRAIARLLPR